MHARFFFFALIVASACTPEPDPISAPHCDGTRRTVALDEVVSGLTAEDVISLSEGTFTRQALTPEDDTQVTVAVAYRGGPAYVCEADGATTSSADIPVAMARGRRIDVQLEVTLSTADGAFDGETRSVFIVAWDASDASAHYPLWTNELNGKPRRLTRHIQAGVFEEPGAAFDGPLELFVVMQWIGETQIGAVIDQGGTPLVSWGRR